MKLFPHLPPPRRDIPVYPTRPIMRVDPPRQGPVYREASFIAPLATNDGAPTDQAREACEAQLIEAFGGFTVETGLEGAWRDPATGRVYRDHSVRYSVASDWTAESRAKLERIAATFARLASQECVYVASGDGAVSFVPPLAA